MQFSDQIQDLTGYLEVSMTAVCVSFISEIIYKKWKKLVEFSLTNKLDNVSFCPNTSKGQGFFVRVQNVHFGHVPFPDSDDY